MDNENWTVKQVLEMGAAMELESYTLYMKHAENAEASENPSRIGTVLKLCALRGDKSLDF